jgi:hypothetical protein
VLGCSRTRKERLKNLEKKDRDVRKVPPRTLEEKAKLNDPFPGKTKPFRFAAKNIQKIPGTLLDTKGSFRDVC